MSEDLLDQATDAVDRARAAGAEEVEATVSRHRSTTFVWREGRPERVQEDAAHGLGVSLYVEGRYAIHLTNDLAPERLGPFLDEAVRLTRLLEPDPHRRIPDPALYEGRAEVDLDLVDESLEHLTREERVGWCRALESEARAHDAVVSVTATVRDGHAQAARASSNGFRGARSSTTVGYGAGVTLSEGETKRPEDGWGAGGTHGEGLPSPGEVGREALRRALARLGARKVASVRTPLVVEREAAAALLARLAGALAAGAVQQGRSFLAGRLGEVVASPLLTWIDDPLLPRLAGSRLFDGEGIAARPRTVLEKGVLRSFYVDTYYGRKLGWRPTTGSPSNVVIEPGEGDLETLLRLVGEGVLVTSWMGGNANLTTGDFSYGMRGHLVEGGVAAAPLGEMNVTGNYGDLLRRLVRVGSDPLPWSPWQVPTLVFEDVQLGGT